MTDSAIKYVGVDGCPAGWIAVGLGDGNESCVKVFGRGKFPSLLEHFNDASVVLVDMPIGLPEDGAPSLRDCDRDARWLLGERWGSVFPVPSRRFVDKMMEIGWGYKDYSKANKWSKKCLGGGISAQSFAITPKIVEVDKALKCDKSILSKVRETHPELCFMALSENNQPMTHKKSEREGFEERCEILRHCTRHVDGLDVGAIYKKARRKESRKTKVADDDILDAIALAITAKLGLQNGNQLRHLPKGVAPEKVIHLTDKNPPTDSNGFPMEMVYVIPNEK